MPDKNFIEAFQKLRFRVLKNGVSLTVCFRFENLVLYMKGSKSAMIPNENAGEACGCGNDRGVKLLKIFERYGLIKISMEKDINKDHNILCRKVTIMPNIWK